MQTNEIVQGDAIQELKKLPDSVAQLIITSPPYYRQRDYECEGQVGQEETPESYLAYLDNVFSECLRVVKPTGAVVFNLGDKYDKGTLMMLPYRFAINCLRHGVRLVNTLQWIKPNPPPKQDNRKLTPSHEPFFIFTKTGDYVFNKEAFMFEEPKKSDRTSTKIGQSYYGLIESSSLTSEQKAKAVADLEQAISDVHNGILDSFRMKIKGIHAEAFRGEAGGYQYRMDRDGYVVMKFRGTKIKQDVMSLPVASVKGGKHPAMFPSKIIRELILLLSNEGDLVLDCFMGSGTTALCAKETNRNFYGIDINPQYVSDAKEMLANLAQSRSDIA